MVDDDICRISGVDRLGELAEDAGLGEAVEAVPDGEHVEQGPEHGKYHDGEEVVEEILCYGSFLLKLITFQVYEHSFITLRYSTYTVGTQCFNHKPPRA